MDGTPPPPHSSSSRVASPSLQDDPTVMVTCRT